MAIKVLNDSMKSANVMIVGTATETIDLDTVLARDLLEGQSAKHCSILSITYDVCSGGSGYVELSWGGSDPIANLSGFGQIISQNVGTPSVPNPTEANTIVATVNGAKAYTIILEIRKSDKDFTCGRTTGDAQYYCRDPYGITPDFSKA